jgi:hypothetical protein
VPSGYGGFAALSCGQAAVVVVGIGIHPVAGELVQRVVGVVGRGWRAVEGGDLLGAVTRRVVGVVVGPEGGAVDVPAGAVVGVDQPRQAVIAVHNSVQVVLAVDHKLFEAQLVAARRRVLFAAVADFKQVRAFPGQLRWTSYETRNVFQCCPGFQFQAICGTFIE